MSPQTVGGLFWCLENEQDFWLDIDKSLSVPTFGLAPELTSESTEMDCHRIFEMFRTGSSRSGTNFEFGSSTEDAEIKNMVALEEKELSIQIRLWVRTLYDFAASYHHAVINRNHLVQALAPLYRGMTHSFLVEHADSSPSE